MFGRETWGAGSVRIFWRLLHRGTLAYALGSWERCARYWVCKDHALSACLESDVFLIEAQRVLYSFIG